MSNFSLNWADLIRGLLSALASALNATPTSAASQAASAQNTQGIQNSLLNAGSDTPAGVPLTPEEVSYAGTLLNTLTQANTPAVPAPPLSPVAPPDDTAGQSGYPLDGAGQAQAAVDTPDTGNGAAGDEASSGATGIGS